MPRLTNIYEGGLSATYWNSGTPTAPVASLSYNFSDWLAEATGASPAQHEVSWTSDPYGNYMTETGSGTDQTEHHFTGKERDSESGNDYFGARYYSSPLGRFMSPDWSAKIEPVPYSKLGNPQTLNLYAYVGNNPITGFDPDGHVDCSGKKAAFAGCAAIAEWNRLDHASDAEWASNNFDGHGAGQQPSSGGTSFWHGLSNLLHGHSWNYVKGTYTVKETETYIIPGDLPPAAYGAAQALKAAAQGRPSVTPTYIPRPVPGPNPIPPQVAPGEIPEIELGASFGRRVGVAILNLVKGFGQNVEVVPVACVVCDIDIQSLIHPGYPDRND